MKTIIKKQLAYWLPVYVWAALIFYFSSTPLTGPTAPSSGQPPINLDYYKHVFAYGFLTFLLWRPFHNSSLKHPEIFAAIITVVYGTYNELYQYFIPGRLCSSFDAFLNLVGAFIVQPVIFGYKRVTNNFLIKKEGKG